MKGKSMIKIILGILAFFIIIIGSYILFMIVTDYKPESEIKINIENNKKRHIKNKDEISITTFNIGYCGTDKDIDFFMDGGTQSRSISKEKTVENLNGIISELQSLNSDIYFLQEVDKRATRSYKINEYKTIKEKFKTYGFTFAINYKVPWVPIPISKPHGQVLSGLTTISKYYIKESTRYDLPGKESFLVQLGELDRCIMVNKIPVKEGKDLVLVNAHLSAYDKGGKIRKEQLGFLSGFLENEYNKGSYVVVGGDWNQQIPGTHFTSFKTTQQKPNWLQDIPKDFKPKGFRWAYDKEVPTSRTMDITYKKGENLLSVIDGFLVSDNVDIIDVSGKDLEFRHTDHNPVTIKLMLK